jgi:hypothetical protein
MTLAAGAFLSGAKSRLLPPWIPLRYFSAAVVYHLLAWAALLAEPARVPRFAGGLGWPVAALHLVTLGVLVMTTMGASLQLLPVATRQAVVSRHAPAAIWWLYTPSVGVLAFGLGTARMLPLFAGAVGVAVALLAYAVLLARNLLGASGMPGVIAHGWGALVSLAVLLGSALSLAGLYAGVPLLARDAALGLHIAFAAYGFMGLFALGLSYVLVPMFALSAAPRERHVIGSCMLAAAALVLAAAAAFGVAPQILRITALALGAAALAWHLRMMAAALRTGLRRALGRSFTLVRIAWAMCAASLVIALALVLDAPWPGLATLFGVVLVAGWLLTFLLGMLQRIAPFLASMHAAAGTRRAPTPSSLTAERPLAWHFHAHVAALVLLAASIIADSAVLAALAAASGVIGAAAYAAFFWVLLRRTGLIHLNLARSVAWIFRYRDTKKDCA